MPVFGPPTPTTTLGSSGSPSVYGSSVTFTATVTGTSPNVPSGTVSFSVDGNPLPQNPIALSGMLGNDHVSTGQVVVSDVTVLTIGFHSVTASYSGDSNYSTSTASAFSQQVSKLPSAVSVVSSSSDAPLGVNVVFIATVTGLTPYADPTQTVTFFVDGVQFGPPVGLSPGPNSTATASSNSISWDTHGSHQVYATYSGDSLYNTSTSGVISQYAVISIPAFAMIATFNPVGDTFPATANLYFVPPVTQANQPLTINWTTTNVYSIRLTATGLDSGVITTLGSGSYPFSVGFPATTMVTLSGFDIIGNPIITVTAFALITGGFGLNFGSVFTS